MACVWFGGSLYSSPSFLFFFYKGKFSFGSIGKLALPYFHPPLITFSPREKRLNLTGDGDFGKRTHVHNWSIPQVLAYWIVSVFYFLCDKDMFTLANDLSSGLKCRGHVSVPDLETPGRRQQLLPQQVNLPAWKTYLQNLKPTALAVSHCILQSSCANKEVDFYT